MTLRELALAPAMESGKARVRVLFLVPEAGAGAVQPVLEQERLPYALKPFNLHDVLEKVSDLLLEAGAIPQSIRQVRREGLAVGKRREGGRMPARGPPQPATPECSRIAAIILDNRGRDRRIRTAAAGRDSAQEKEHKRPGERPVTPLELRPAPTVPTSAWTWLRVRRLGKQFAHGLVRDGMAQARRKFGQRHQHETPALHARVRHLQIRRADHARTIKQDIQVQRARAASDGAPPAQSAFDVPSARAAVAAA